MRRRNYFEKFLKLPEQRASLAEAALHIAQEEYPDLKVSVYTGLLQEWANEVKRTHAQKPPHIQIDGINELMFGEMNFCGSIDSYFDPKSSYLNQVMDRRSGIPVTLSVIYLELAWVLGLPAVGVAFPGYFFVRILNGTEPLYIDTFHKGKLMTAQQCVEFVNDMCGEEQEFRESYLEPVTKRQILCRMLRHLKGIYVESKNYSRLVQILDQLIVLSPEAPEEIRDRGIIYYQMLAFKLALSDFETFLSLAPASEDADVIQQYLAILREHTSHLN